MIRFQNLNNLDEYLKKTEADNIYMKKINSLQVSFTSLLTSITNKFYDYDTAINNIEINTLLISNNTNSLNSSITSLSSLVGTLSSNQSSMSDLIGSLSSNQSSISSSLTNLASSYNTCTAALNNNFNSLSSSLTDLSNSFTTFRTSVNNEISNLWNAIGAEAGGYNYWKEFNKASAETYINYGHTPKVTELDNEQFIYNQYLYNSTLLNPSKLSYVFNSNILQTTANQPFNFGGDYNRIGLILPDCQSGATTYNQSVPMNLITATCYTLDVMLKYRWSDFNTNFYIKCLDANLMNESANLDYNLISTNLNATAIHFANYHKNGNNTLYSTFKLNDRVEVLGPWFFDNYNVHIDLRRHTLPYSHSDYANLPRLNMFRPSANLYLRNSTENGYGIGKLYLNNDVAYITNVQRYVFDLQCSNGYAYLLNSLTSPNQSYTVTVAPEFVARTLFVTVPNNVSLIMPTGINSFVNGNNNQRVWLVNSNQNQSLTIENWNALTCAITGVPYLTVSNNTLKDFTIATYASNAYLKSITYRNNYVSWCKYDNSCSSMINLNYNTFENFLVTDYGKGFSFGANFKNSFMRISAPSSGTYYSYNNPNATIEVSQGLFQFLDVTAGTISISAGGSMENCVYSSMVVNAMNGTPPYGPWRYVWCNSFELNNPVIFYENKLCFDYAFYHCPFIQLGHTAFNAGLNAEGYDCSGELMLVANAPTTSVNFRLTGNNTSKSINARIMEDQQYVIKVDIRGWHPSRIIGFDQNYLFKNVASGYSAVPDQKFTAIVDNTADWNAYKMFFNPFGTPDENRIVLSTA